MDPLSGGASVLAFVGLAAQLAQNIKKLYDFWSSIQDAPQEIRAIGRDISLVANILEEIAQEEEHHLYHPTSRAALLECEESLQALTALVVDLEPSFASSSRRIRKWSSLKAVLRKDKIKRIQASLSETKISLSLSLQSSLLRTTRLQHELLSSKLCSFQFENSSDSVESDLLLKNPIYRSGFSHLLSRTRQDNSCRLLEAENTTNEAFNSSNSKKSTSSLTLVARTSSNLDPLPTKPRGAKKLVSYSRFESIFGELTTQKSRHSRQAGNINEFSNGEEETETTFYLRPSKWLLNLGLNFEACAKVSWSLGGLNLLQQTYRVVPRDSQIFNYCREGDLQNVKLLFSHGKASVWDIDEYGQTPLHHAARGYHVELCRFLLEAGGQAKRSLANFSPITESFYGQNYYPAYTENATDPARSAAMLEAQINTQRLFLVYSPEDYAEEMLIFLTRDYFWARNSTHKGLEIIFRSMLQSSQVLKEDIEYLVDHSASTRIQIARRLWAKSDFLELRGGPRHTLDDYDDVIESNATKLGFSSLLHSCLITKPASISSILKSGVYLHPISRERFRKPQRSRFFDKKQSMSEICTWLDTPTSLAMYNSDDFHYWRSALLESGINLQNFVDEELAKEANDVGDDILNFKDEDRVVKMPFQDSDWSNQTLLSLFQRELSPSICEKVCMCETEIGREANESKLKQPKWLQFLGMVKRIGGQIKTLESVDYPPNSFSGNQDALEIDTIEMDPSNTTEKEISSFCFADHIGCYVCEHCWFITGYKRDFWDTRDIDPHFEMPNLLSEVEVYDDDDDGDSPFLLSF